MDKRTREYKEMIAEKIKLDSVEERTAFVDSFNDAEPISLDDVEKATVEISRNIGDKVAKVLKATGVEKAVKLIFGENCGCDERIEKLNAAFLHPAKCLEELEYNYLDKFFTKNENLQGVILQPSQQLAMIEIYKRVFNRNWAFCASCGAVALNNIKMLKQVYDTYE